MKELENLKSIKDIAEMYKVTKMTIYRVINEKKIPYKIIGKRKFYNPTDFITDGK